MTRPPGIQAATGIERPMRAIVPKYRFRLEGIHFVLRNAVWSFPSMRILKVNPESLGTDWKRGDNSLGHALFTVIKVLHSHPSLCASNRVVF